MKIPKTYLPVMPYLILNRATAFLDYAKSVFGAKEQFIMQGEEPHSIMHGEIKIHDAVIMFAGATETWTEKTSGMFLYVKNVDKVYSAGIAQGGKSLQEPSQQSYGYSAGFEDPFGNHWWITMGE